MNEFFIEPKPSDFFELPKIEEQGIVLPKVTDFIEVPEKENNAKEDLLIRPFEFAKSIDDGAELLLGYKGRSFVDAGFVYAPYIPVQSTMTLFPAENMHETRGLEHKQCTMSEFETSARSVDAGEEIASSMGNEIRKEMDREIMERMRAGAQKYYGRVNIRSG